MESFGYTIRQFEGYTGFTAELTVNPAYRLIAYRTDIDGLEMPDMTCNEHSSVHEGCAHNCGHDTHMTIALTAAKYLSEHRDELTHNVRFVFQMAEEDMRVRVRTKWWKWAAWTVWMKSTGCITTPRLKPAASVLMQV